MIGADEFASPRFAKRKAGAAVNAKVLPHASLAAASPDDDIHAKQAPRNHGAFGNIFRTGKHVPVIRKHGVVGRSAHS
jgi:hypothetical protein